MRLRRLDLTRYGRFTDHRIDFGERREGEPDLHIVYGPNEAGKSTTLNAFLDLLFGIEPRSRYNFLHPYPSMRIGAVVELPSGVREVARVRRGLLGHDGQPVADGVLLGELGGIDRDAYRTMFSLDDETLEAGGKSILESRGELGRLLFSASAGLAELSHSLSDIRTEADGFYRFRARSGVLSQLKDTLAALKDERDRIDTLASDYARLVEARDRAAAQYEQAIAGRGRIQARLDEVQRHLGAWPRLTALRDLRQRLAPLADLPPPPLGLRDELPALQAAEVSLATRAEGIDAEVRRLSAELDAAVVDEAALAAAGRLERLEEPRSRYVTACKDIPERRLQLRDVELALAGILARLGRAGEPDPGRLVIPATAVGTLRELIERRSGIEAALVAAGGERERAAERLDAAVAMLRAAAGGADVAEDRGGAPAAALAGTVSALRQHDHQARLRLAGRSVAALREVLDERLAALRPWSGGAEELAALPVPAAGEIERLKTGLREAGQKTDRLAGEVERLDRERLRLDAELQAMTTVADVVTDADAAAARSAREQSWAVHRRLLDPASADVFEAALRRDDQVMDGRLRHEKEIASLHQSSRRLAVCEAELAQAREFLAAAMACRRDLVDAVAATVGTISPDLPAAMTAEQLEDWLARRGRALEARDELRRAERDLQEAETGAATARATLAGALDAAGVSHPPEAGFDALMASAAVAVERDTELRSLIATVTACRADATARERALTKAVAADTEWRAAWSQACSGCWLGDGGTVPAVASVRAGLEALAELGPAIEKRSGLLDRIAKMEADCAAFATEAADAARQLGLAAEAGDALELARGFEERVRAAQRVAAARAEGQKARAEAVERRRAVGEALAVHAARAAGLMRHFGAASLAEVGARLQDAERKAELDERIVAAELEIREALRVPSIADAEACLDGADRPALEVELAELRARFEDVDQRTRDLFAEQRSAADRLEAVGGDAAAAHIEERRRTILLEVEDKAGRYLRLRLGVLAAEQALRAYRDRHRSTMMTRASQAFRTISRGAYAGLSTQPDKDGEILIANAADGGSKLAVELSKGTRFQLYLALRVAGYQEFAETRRAVPFVADDIMETFDDFRAEEACRLFSQMATVGQVIYLTHHRHLCEIARGACPGVRVHELVRGG